MFGNGALHDNRVPITATTPYQSISAQIQMRGDRDGTLDIHTITNDLISSQFAHLETATVNLGYSDSVYWFKVMLDNRESKPVDIMMEIPFPLLDKVDGFLLDDSLNTEHIIEQFSFGDHQKFTQRPLLSPAFVKPIRLPAEKVWLYLRVETSSPVHVPVFIADDQSYAEYVTIRQWLSGIFYGLALALVCYNLMLFSALRDKTYAYYSMFIVALFMFYASVDGYAYWLWADNISWQAKAHIYFIYLALGLAVEFSRLFLSVGAGQPMILRHTRILIGVCVASILVTPYLEEVYAAILMSLVAGVVLTYLLVVGVVRLRDGVPMAGLYVIVWGMLLVTAFMNVLASNGLLFDFTDVNGYMKLASTVELFLLSFGVGSKINAIRDRQIRAERHALHFSEEARRAEKHALAVQREANRTLEEKVQERTGQLETAMKDLHHANNELKRLSETDALTGLYNRRKFEECFNERILTAQQIEAMAVFMLIDIDFFKKLNDQYGHDMGDLCLQKVAFVLASLSEKFGFQVARFGGEEFAVATVVTKPQRALELAEIIRGEIEKIVIPEQHEIRITVSVGCHAQSNPSLEARSQLMKLADIALYRAKANGRNCVIMDGVPANDGATNRPFQQVVNNPLDSRKA